MSETQPLEFHDVRINVPWGYIAGRWYGNRNVRPILALHGWQDNMGTWDRLIPLLPRHIGILCIDFPGHGRSSRYPHGIIYHMVDFTHIIMLVMKEYQWKKVSLLGHSLGGVVSFIYTTLYPRTVDMLIQIDIIRTPKLKPDRQIQKYAIGTDKLFVENERLQMLNKREPPSYSYEELEEVLNKGSRNSVDKDNSKYLLNRGILQSKQYPEKFYFSRDGRVKYYHEFQSYHGLDLEMAKRIKNINYLVIKSSTSNYISADSLELIQKLRENNPNFEMYEIEGSHHVHLNNPHEVAEKIVPFILKHRPVSLDTWSVDDKDESVSDNIYRTNFKSKM